MPQPPLIPTIIDVEASGFGRGSYPVEVGYVLPDGRRDCTLIKPLPDWTHWDEEAAALHQIDRQTLCQHGLSVVEVAHWLNRALQGQVVYSDAWGQDMPWLGKLFDAADMMPSFRLEALQVILSEAQLRAWIDVRTALESESRLRRHRASADAWLIQQTYLRSYLRTAPQTPPQVYGKVHGR